MGTPFPSHVLLFPSTTSVQYSTTWTPQTCSPLTWGAWMTYGDMAERMSYCSRRGDAMNGAILTLLWQGLCWGGVIFCAQGKETSMEGVSSRYALVILSRADLASIKLFVHDTWMTKRAWKNKLWFWKFPICLFLWQSTGCNCKCSSSISAHPSAPYVILHSQDKARGQRDITVDKAPALHIAFLVWSQPIILSTAFH